MRSDHRAFTGKGRSEMTKNQRARPRNERVSNTRQRRQQHLLDVRVRSHKATQHRNRRVLVLTSKITLVLALGVDTRTRRLRRSEEHTSELQSQSNLVCRLL